MNRWAVALAISAVYGFTVVSLSAETIGRVVAPSGLTVRSGPGKHHNRLFRIPTGTAVEILEFDTETVEVEGRSGVWTKIQWEDSVGWAFGGFLHIPPAKKTEPVGAVLKSGPSGNPLQTKDPGKGKPQGPPASMTISRIASATKIPVVTPPVAKTRTLPVGDIEPARGIGALLLGMKRGGAVTLLGKPAETRQLPQGVTLDIWKKPVPLNRPVSQSAPLPGSLSVWADPDEIPVLWLFSQGGKVVQIASSQKDLLWKGEKIVDISLQVFCREVGAVTKTPFSGGDYALIVQDAPATGIAFLWRWEAYDNDLPDDRVFPEFFCVHLPGSPILMPPDLVKMDVF
jgi:hypothetical protein